MSPDPRSRELMALTVRSIERRLGSPLRFRAAANGELALHAAGDWAGSIEAAEPALVASGRNPLVLQTLASSYVEKGEMEIARAIYEELLARAKREPVSPIGLAVVAAAIRETAQAIAYTRDAIRRHDPQLVVYARCWPQSGALRAMPEFQQMLMQLGFPGM